MSYSSRSMPPPTAQTPSRAASRDSMRPPSPLRRVPVIGAPGAMSPPPTHRASMSPLGRTLRRPMSMASLPSTTPSSRASSAASSRASASPSTFRGTIHVGVRVRPEVPPPGGAAAAAADQWFVDDASSVVGHATAGDFSYDEVYGGAATNARVFDRSARQLVHQVVEGFNATVFAYGMTGSGKTFSMQGDATDPGIITRAVELLFELLRARASPTNVRVSYLEIYNERVCDLLVPDPTRGPEVTLRDDPVLGVRALNLSETAVQSASELLAVVARGDINRRTSSTQFNLHSSRSHAVVQISVAGMGRQSTLYLCDLAGSERAVAQADRRKEGAYINKSLLTLGTVISRLSTGGLGHIPFRDSKLTRLLQPSLTGRAIVAVLCTIQTLSSTTTETLNTLRFAARAKNIVVTAKRNSVVDDVATAASNERLLGVIEQQRVEIAQLKADVDAAAAAKEDLQGQLDFYMRLADQNAEDSLEDILRDDHSALSASTHPNAGAPPLSSAERAEYEERAQSDRAENERLKEQLSALIGQMAEANNELARLQPHAGGRQSLDVAKADLLDEITELRETLDDKNRIIEFLRGSNERRANLDKLAAPPNSVPPGAALPGTAMPAGGLPRGVQLPVSPPQADFD